MQEKQAGAIGFATNALTGKTVKSAKAYRKSVLEKTPNDTDAVAFAQKSVKAAKNQRDFVRGTGVAGVGGAYIATKNKGEESLIPKDY